MSKRKSQPTSETTIFTIGFTKKNASEFFSGLRDAGVRLLVDVRLNNASQLAGFTKKPDLEYFLEAIANIRYIHLPDLAPTKDLLNAYRKKEIDWEEYERRFSELMQERRIEKIVTPEQMNMACLLCSEPTADNCHRRLVAEYLRQKWGNVEVRHL